MTLSLALVTVATPEIFITPLADVIVFVLPVIFNVPALEFIVVVFPVT